MKIKSLQPAQKIDRVKIGKYSGGTPNWSNLGPVPNRLLRRPGSPTYFDVYRPVLGDLYRGYALFYFDPSILSISRAPCRYMCCNPPSPHFLFLSLYQRFRSILVILLTLTQPGVTFSTNCMFCETTFYDIGRFC